MPVPAAAPTPDPALAVSSPGPQPYVRLVLTTQRSSGASPSTPVSTVNADTQANLLASSLISERVRKAVGTDATTTTLLSGLTVTASPGGEVLLISHSGIEGHSGDEIATAFAEALLDFRSDVTAEDRRQEISIIKRQLRYEQSLKRNLTLRIAKAASERERLLLLSPLTGIYARLSSLYERLVIVQAKDPLDVGRVLPTGVQVDESESTTPDVEHEPAALPKPYARNLVAGLLLGAILGFGIALLQDLLDQRFKEPADLEGELDIPVLAIVRNSSSETDSYRRVIISLMPFDERPGLAVVSMSDHDIVISAIDNLDEAARLEGLNAQRLDLHQGAERLSVSRVRSAAKDASSTGNLVLVGAPNLLDSAQSLAISAAFDRTLLLIDLARTTRPEATRARDELHRAGATVAGAIVFES